jgi:hypothetical protein
MNKWEGRQYKAKKEGVNKIVRHHCFGNLTMGPGEAIMLIVNH